MEKLKIEHGENGCPHLVRTGSPFNEEKTYACRNPEVMRLQKVQKHFLEQHDVIELLLGWLCDILKHPDKATEIQEKLQNWIDYGEMEK